MPIVRGVSKNDPSAVLVGLPDGPQNGEVDIGKRPVGDRCGMCHKGATPLTRTECCRRLVCDEGAQYALGMRRRSGCGRNHSRYTLCGFHHGEGHAGDWKTCVVCRNEFELEMYVYYGMNKYNFDKLESPPAYEPTHCVGCGRVIVLGRDGYCTDPRGYCCEDCIED